ncbi:MAG: hypothetical protein AAB483_00870 [Patescibacteria group bacterium]
MIGVAGLIVIIGLIWFLATRGSEPEVTPTPTPTEEPTPTPTPVPQGFENIFPLDSTLLLYRSAAGARVALDTFNTSINQQTLAPGSLKMYRVGISQSDNLAVTPAGLLTDLGITMPTDLSGVLEVNTPIVFSLFGKPDSTNGRGFLLKLQPAANAEAILASWESTMTTALKDLFKITPSRAASTGFLENTYQGVKVRYRNFGDALNSIDYAVLTMPNGDRYIVFTNTRDHIFRVIDTLVGAVPGK